MKRYGKFISFLIIAVILFLSFLIPLFSTYDILKVNLDESLLSPGLKHIMGTDILGRDVFVRTLYAARISLFIGIISTLLAFVIGIIIGGVAGFYGGLVDSLLMRIVDIFLSFPYIIGALAFLAVFGPGIINTIFVIVLFTWSIFARLYRSSVMEVKEKEYVRAAEALGLSKIRIMFLHIFPNGAGPVLAYFPLAIGGSILAESSLSFLGLGVPPPIPSWGQMVADSAGLMSIAPWLMFFPGVFISLTVLAFILLFEQVDVEVGLYENS